MSNPVGFGVIGANSFVANAAVLPAIDAAPNARLVATASRSGDVPDRWSATAVESYEAVLEHPDVEAVYIPLPNGMHREWTQKSADAGKHVLCEKPLAADSAVARAMAQACERAGVLLAEAWMTPFHERYRSVIGRAGSGAIGDVVSIDSAFRFTIGPEAADNYRWDPAQGGGALLDVGIYCLGAIVELFDSTPSSITAAQRLTERGVDAVTTAELSWSDGRSASIGCSFVDDETQTLRIAGSAGAFDVETEAFTGGAGHDTFLESLDDGTRHRVHVDSHDPYTSMICEFARAVRGEAEWPRPVERSIEMLALIERIKETARDRAHDRSHDRAHDRG